MVALSSHGVPEEIHLGCPLDDLGQLCEYANQRRHYCLAKDTTTNGLCQNVEHDLDVEVSHPEVINAIKQLSDNKSCGLDGIHAEHLKHCSDIIIPLLSKCFTGLLVHGTLPESMIDVVLVPIVKNKRASICSKANYRPIALASIVSKIFEKLLYDCIAYALTTCSNQFGVKTKHSTDMCIYYAFKEAVLKYRSLNSNVYSCFLAFSKAFDRVNHYVLFDKLLKRGVPLYVVRILIFGYTSQTMYVRWNNVIPSGFGISNGVRQGGILSPYLSCVYMDDLSIKLNDIKVGCTIGTTLINHLTYTDDLVLLSPSAMGLSLLLSVCSSYGLEHDLKYNSAKSKVMIFRCNKMKDIRISNFELNNVLLTTVTQYTYLEHCI